MYVCSAALGGGEQGNRLGPRSWRDLAQQSNQILKSIDILIIFFILSFWSLITYQGCNLTENAYIQNIIEN